jgi:hypothetical protein
MKKAIGQFETANYTKWIRRMAKDQRLLATHISLYTALFICWQRQEFAQPFSVSRRQLMGYSKIASIATYHKCMKELDAFGYIRYEPSYHPKLGSQIYWPDALMPYSTITE